MKVLDAACGSGVFLVLAYRRLIELELGKRRRRFLPPERLGQILKDSIFGVEVILDACYVTEFSLILTLLSYVDPPDLDKNESFQFPDLHNKNIFNCDFFDDSSIFWKRQQKFNWVVGNPSWSKLHAETAADEQPNAWNWINKNEELKPIGKYSLSEAFSWRVTDVLAEQGHSGLLLHGTSLFNRSSVAYRREFFKQHEVSRITNFANLAYILFKGRSDAPAASVIYSKTRSNREKPPIIHYGPFVANQIFFRQNGQELGP
jgi:type I restriction-modification system DNA methylase subunit